MTNWMVHTDAKRALRTDRNRTGEEHAKEGTELDIVMGIQGQALTIGIKHLPVVVLKGLLAGWWGRWGRCKI